LSARYISSAPDRRNAALARPVNNAYSTPSNSTHHPRGSHPGLRGPPTAPDSRRNQKPLQKAVARRREKLIGSRSQGLRQAQAHSVLLQYFVAKQKVSINL